MRIQHNIMAMTAYRNYTNNVSAMKKNLEKLSSGYKINRAGDDAAGLAISEKMRAQITGLETAQKNAKDGISLVQTAEGALTEVHDMLNRMVELATQSANGTYDNDTDRYQLQKEMDQLRAEIDRIADSSNFNGIQLLDGSMDAGGDVTYTTGSFEVKGAHATTANGAIELPAKGEVLGTNTVVHSDAVTGSDTNAFAIDLHNLQLGKDGQIEITIGTTKFTMASAATADMTASDIATAFKTSGGFKDSTGTNIDPTSVDIGGTKYSVTASGTRLTFTQLATDTTTPTIPAEVTVAEVAATGNGGGAAGNGTQAELEVTAEFDNDSNNFAFSGGDTVTFTSNGATALNLVLERANDGTWSVKSGAVDGYTATFDGSKLTLTQDTAADTTGSPFGTVSVATSVTADNASATVQGTPSWTDGVAASAGGGGTTTDKLLTGDYNKSTTVISTKQASEAERLASTTFTLTADMTSEGSQLTIGRDTYTFTTDKSKIGKDGYVVYNEGDSLDKKVQLLTEAAKGNTTYTVGHQGTGGVVTITENPGQTNFDLTTVEGIEKSLGFKTATTNPTDTSKGLTLQIGPTAESFNQLKVNIKDCHVKALGIGDIDISTQDGAQEAVDAIKSAINYVSDVRGTLGATQNRLDHTINNLSVMTENIQDAESTIRDVDVAEEMMAYTKNNILIQASQAMLAQANQVPQGVLQLLQ